jgi:hypothetical protein
MMIKERIPTIRIIDLHDIPLVAIANLAEVEPQRVSDYVAHRAVNRQRIAAIEQAVREIETVIISLDPLKINISDPNTVRLVLADIAISQTQARSELDREIEEIAGQTIRELSVK